MEIYQNTEIVVTYVCLLISKLLTIKHILIITKCDLYLHAILQLIKFAAHSLTDFKFKFCNCPIEKY